MSAWVAWVPAKGQPVGRDGQVGDVCNGIVSLYEGQPRLRLTHMTLHTGEEENS
jgi:hypothetical protein